MKTVKISIMKYLSLLYLCCTLLYSNGIAQINFSCGTLEDEKEEEYRPVCKMESEAFLNYYQHQFNFVPTNIDPIKTIKINFQIWQPVGVVDGSGNWQNTNDHIMRLMDVVDMMNEELSSLDAPEGEIFDNTFIPDSRLRVELGGIYFYQNDSIWNNSFNRTYAREIISQVDPDRLKAVNIHIARQHHCSLGTDGCINESCYLGYAPLGGGFNPQRKLWDIVTFFSDPDDIDCSQINLSDDTIWAKHHLMHELGHMLGLRHLYNCIPRYCNFNDQDYLFDIYGDVQQFWCVDPSPGCNVCSIRAPNLNCNDGLNPYLDCGDPSNPCSNNILGAGKVGGVHGYHLSPLQLGRMHRSLAFSGIRNYACGLGEYAFEINQDEVWDFNIKFYQDIIVKSGVTLTIKCHLEMTDFTKIIIERGARLVVDSATITNGCDGQWGGIEVWGNADKMQPALSAVLDGSYPASSEDQGVVIIKNESLIENAANAVTLSKRDCGEACLDLDYTGGVVYAENSQFYNNKRTAEFIKYTIDESISRFLACEIIIDDNYLTTVNPPFSQITNWEVEDVLIVNCTFKNEMVANDYSHNGVASIDGTFDVSFTSFYNQDTAIIIKEDQGISGDALIRNNTATNTTRFASIEGITNLNISHNTILYGPQSLSGIEVANCSGFNIQNNGLSRIDGPITDEPTKGLILKNNGNITSIAGNNSFHDISTAIKSIGDNSGLKILCNQFYSSDFDIQIANNGPTTGAIHPSQGAIDDPAGNLFSADCPYPGTHIDMEPGAVPFTYYHHIPKAYKPLCVVGNPTIINTGIVYDTNSSCNNNTNDEDGFGQVEAHSNIDNGLPRSNDLFRIFPNPANNSEYITIIHLKESNARESSLEIINTLGVKVHEELINQENTIISIENWDSGIYFVNIISQKTALVQFKFIVAN